MESEFLQNLDEIDNIFIYFLIEKIPIKKIILLKESCKFFNNIIIQCKKQKAVRDYCSLLKDKISTKKDIKIFNILIGQIKLFDLISSFTIGSKVSLFRLSILLNEIMDWIGILNSSF